MKGIFDFIKTSNIQFIDLCGIAAFFINFLNFIFLVIATIAILFFGILSLLEDVELFVGLINEMGDLPFKVLFLSLVVHIVTKEFYKKTLSYKEID
jgi:hypothetical protein